MKSILKFIFFHLIRDPGYLFWYIIRRLQDQFSVEVKFLTLDEVFSKLINERKSFIRLWDGEVFIIHHGSMWYEPFHAKLRKGLLNIIKNYNQSSNYILSLPEMDINKTNIELKRINRLELWLPSKILYERIFAKNMKYGDTVTFYRSSFRPHFRELIKNRDLIIVSRQEIIENLNSNYLSICHSYDSIITPDYNSYAQKDEIIWAIESRVQQAVWSDILLIFACGPCSKILAYDFCLKGIQSIDIWRGIELISFRSDGDLEFQI